VIYYSLIRSGSNEVISIFEWDEIASGSVTDSITFPSGTLLQEVSATASFTSSADYTDFVNVGVFGGFFSGSVYISEYDTFNINNNFIIYSPTASNSGSVYLSLSGSVDISGSVTASNFTGSFTGSFNGYLYGTASYVISSSNSITASYAITSSNTVSASNSISSSYSITASYAITSSNTVSASNSISSSYAITASYALSTTPYSTIEIFEQSSNWTKPSWAKKIKVILIGGGGGGGSAYGLTDSNMEFGGGGGAGGSLTVVEFDSSTLPTSSISVFVGGGGFRGQSANDGGNGGLSQFGNYAYAAGGQGGQGRLSNRPKPNGFNLHLGGVAQASLNFTNTGGGPGGMGSVKRLSTIIFGPQNTLEDFECAIAPSLPYADIYLRAKPMYFNGDIAGWNGSLNIPGVIAPTGGGGGLGYETAASGEIEANPIGATIGGSIKSSTAPYNNLNGETSFGIAPLEYNKNGTKSRTHTNLLDHYPAFNTKIGLGGTGGFHNPPSYPSGSFTPQAGSKYGGGGGGAYAGGIQYSTDPNEITYNDGADGASGVVVIISEA
jgi:hypothetical protein